MPGTITAENGESLEFDIIQDENWGLNNAITDFPVEDGSVFSDHIQRQPDTFTIHGVISLTPFQTNPSVQAPATRLEDAVRFLESASESVVSYDSVRRGLISPLGIEQVSYVVDDRDRYIFTIGFKSIRIAEAQIVSIPPERLPPTKQDDVPDEVDTGDQSTDDADDQTADAATTGEKSLASDAYDWTDEKAGGFKEQGGFVGVVGELFAEPGS